MVYRSFQAGRGPAVGSASLVAAADAYVAHAFELVLGMRFEGVDLLAPHQGASASCRARVEVGLEDRWDARVHDLLQRGCPVLTDVLWVPMVAAVFVPLHPVSLESFLERRIKVFFPTCSTSAQPLGKTRTRRDPAAGHRWSPLRSAPPA